MVTHARVLRRAPRLTLNLCLPEPPLNGSGAPTEAGKALHAEVEARTDSAALGPWMAIGERDTTHLEAILRPLAQQVAASGVVPFPNPMGLPPLAAA